MADALDDLDIPAVVGDPIDPPEEPVAAVSAKNLRRAGKALPVIEEEVKGKVAASETEWSLMRPQFKVTLLFWRLARLAGDIENGYMEEPEDADWSYQ